MSSVFVFFSRRRAAPARADCDRLLPTAPPETKKPPARRKKPFRQGRGVSRGSTLISHSGSRKKTFLRQPCSLTRIHGDAYGGDLSSARRAAPERSSRFSSAGISQPCRRAAGSLLCERSEKPTLSFSACTFILPLSSFSVNRLIKISEIFLADGTIRRSAPSATAVFLIYFADRRYFIDLKRVL